MRSKSQVVAAIKQIRRRKRRDSDEHAALTNIIDYIAELERDSAAEEYRRDRGVLLVERIRLVNALREIQNEARTITQAREVARLAISRLELGLEKR